MSMNSRQAFSILSRYSQLVVPKHFNLMPGNTKYALNTLITDEVRGRWLGTHIGCLLQWIKFVPNIPDDNELHFERLFRHADKYPTADAFLAAIKDGQCLEKGAFINDPGTGVMGFIVGEGTVTTKKWPAWTIDRGGGRVEVFPKDTPGLKDVTGCEDGVLVSIWDFATLYRRPLRAKRNKGKVQADTTGSSTNADGTPAVAAVL